MSTAVATVDFTTDQVDLIRRTLCKDLGADELALFLAQCKRTGLDPFAKQIYGQKRAGRMVVITGIDGYRLIADRTDRYAGSDDAVFDDEAEPSKATVTVWKIVGGARCAFTASARWSEYYPGDKAGEMWRKMPCTMLAKCAEALALRKAFPQELGGLYTDAEMDQAERPPVVRTEPAGGARAIAAPGPAASAIAAGRATLQAAATLAELQAAWLAIPAAIQAHLAAVKDQCKSRLSSPPAGEPDEDEPSELFDNTAPVGVPH